jgi:PPOX class probable F420-dependent enzyme
MAEHVERGVSPAARDFLKAHELAVLSTLGRDGEVHAAVVNYLFDKDDCFYILTKAETTKAHDMLANPQVAVTVYDAAELTTTQIQGVAEIEADLEQKTRVFEEIVQPRDYGGDVLLPPSTQLSAGGFITFRITPETIKYRNFKKSQKD